jgi:hypothetical protein
MLLLLLCLMQDCLKYVVLANMLALSDINPFAAREAKVSSTVTLASVTLTSAKVSY